MTKSLAVFSLTLLAMLQALPALAGSEFVLIERTEPAYTVYAGIPGEKEAEVRDKLKAAPEGVEMVDWEAFEEGREQYISAQIKVNAYPASRAVEGIVALIRKYPGTPFGLTWNGGIAFTYNDYQYAKRIYQQYQADPDTYLEHSKKQDPRADPINPGHHLRPLLGW